MKVWEWIVGILFAAFMWWLLSWAIEQGNECERRGGVMVYKTGCIKAQRI